MAKREIIVELQLQDKNAVQELGRLQTETRKYQQSIKLLNSIIDENGYATKRQQAQIGELTAKIENNRVKVREMKNDLSGATDAGMRFRDKMADATLEAIRNSGIIGKLDAQLATLKNQMAANTATIAANEKAMAGLAAKYDRGEIEAKEYNAQLAVLRTQSQQAGTANEKLSADVNKVSGAISGLDKKVEDLTADLKAGRITAEQYKAGVASINSEVAKASGAFTQGVSDLKNYALGMIGVVALLQKGIEAAKEIVELAGRIEKTDARNRAIAGDSLPAFEEAAKKTANALGLTERQYVSLAANQKLALNQLGLEGAQYDELSTKVVEYADLLGDFSAGTLSTEEATKLLNDALLGKTKGLKELGINVKASKDELDALKQEIMESRGVTDSQAEALANLELAFRATSAATAAFTGEELALDKAQDLANARMEEAKEALSKSLTPAIISATEAQARYIESLSDFVSEGGAFRKFVAVITAGFSETTLGMWEAWFGDAGEAVKSTVEEVKKAPEAIKGSIDAFEVVGTKTRTIAELRDQLKGLKEARENLLTTDAAGIAQSDKAIAALEKELKAIDGSAKAIDKKTEAVKKLTAAQLAQFDAESAINIDARSNPFAIEATDQGTFRMPDEVAEVEEGLAAKIAAYDAEQMAFADLQDAKVQAAQAFTATLANLAGEDTEVARALFLLSKLAAVAEVFINLQREIAAYSANPTWSLFPDGGAAIKAKAIAAAKIRAAASIAVIASQGFEEGGFTSKRSSDSEPVGVVHANEYVVPAPILRTRKGKALVDQIEGIRRGLSVRFAPPFVSGGPTRRSGVVLTSEGAGGQLRAGGIASADLARAISSMPPPQVSVVEFREVMRRVDVIENLSKA